MKRRKYATYRWLHAILRNHETRTLTSDGSWACITCGDRMPFCGDCPDREACSQGVPCDTVRRVNAP